MKIYPNQRIITVSKKPDPQNEYITFSKSSFEYARQNLSPMAFEAWTYLASNEDKKCFALSSTDLRKQCHDVSHLTYANAFKKLIDEGYLHHDGGNNFTFFEVPKCDVIPMMAIIDRP